MREGVCFRCRCRCKSCADIVRHGTNRRKSRSKMYCLNPKFAFLSISESEIKNLFAKINRCAFAAEQSKSGGQARLGNGMLRNGVHSVPCAKPPQGLISQRENAVRRLRRSHYIMQCSRSAMPCALFKQARRACFRELGGIKIIVIPFEFQQFAMCAGFGDSSVADNKNSVR